MIELLDPVARARSIVGLAMPYELGTGGYRPRYATRVGAAEPDARIVIEDLPWTSTTREDGSTVTGSDCAGFAISWCHRLERHRPGFNRTRSATVSDDLNTDSSVEDATDVAGHRELFEPVIAPTLGIALAPAPGDLLVYKAIRLAGHPHPWIGHVAIVLEVAAAFDPHAPDWHLVTVAQCCGPNGRTPAVLETDGAAWARHDRTWGDHVDRRSVVIRVAAGAAHP